MRWTKSQDQVRQTKPADHLDLICKCDGKLILLYSWTKDRDKWGISESLGWDIAYQVNASPETQDEHQLRRSCGNSLPYSVQGKIVGGHLL